jgi:RNA polymerase sigma-70 factor (ECF subfamily)
MRTEMASEIPTSALVASASEGDRHAFDEIVRRYRNRLEHQIRARLGAKLRAKLDVEDVAQEVFSVAFRTIGSFRWRDEESFYRWLGSIAEHHVLSASQKKAWNEIRLPAELGGRDVSPSHHLRREERFERLEAALAGLSEDHRRVVLLARVEGLTAAEIAVRMHRSPEAVKMLLGRALLRLKQIFGDTESLHLPDRRFKAEGHGGDE